MALQSTADWHLDHLRNGWPDDDKARLAAAFHARLDEYTEDFPGDVEFYRRQLRYIENPPPQPPQHVEERTYTADEIRRIWESVNPKPDKPDPQEAK